MVALNFNSQEYQPSVGGKITYPGGTYLMVITNSSAKNTATGAGTMLVLDMKIVDGPYKDGKFEERLNYTHTNETTQRMARQELSAIARVVGVPQFTDTQQLHGIPFRVVLVEVENEYQDKNTGEMKKGKQNNVVDILDMNGNAAINSSGPNTPPAVGQQQAQPPAQGGFQQQQNLAQQPPAQAQSGFPPQTAPGGFAPQPQQGGFPAQGQQQGGFPSQGGAPAPGFAPQPQQGGFQPPAAPAAGAPPGWAQQR